MRSGRKYLLSLSGVLIAVGAIVGFVASISKPATWDSTAILLPEASNLSSAMSNFKRTSILMGSTLNFSQDAIKPVFYADIITSPSFLYGILDTCVSTSDGEVNTILRDYLSDYQKTSWITKVLSFPMELVHKVLKKEPDSLDSKMAKGLDDCDNFMSEEETELVRTLSNLVSVQVNYSTKRSIINVSMQDPLVAFQTASAIIENLDGYVNDYRKKKNQEELESISAICEEEKARLISDMVEYAETYDSNLDLAYASAKTDLEFLESKKELDIQIYAQIYMQYKLAEFKVLSSSPAFLIVQPPLISSKPSGPNLLHDTAGASAVFLIVGLIVYFIITGGSKKKLRI